MARQKLGQNFLVSEELALQIVCLGQIQDTDFVLEIGPGKGVLTQLIIREAKSFAAIELDQKLAEKLKRRYRDQDGIQVFVGDAAKFDYLLLESHFKVISNLPYCAAVAILTRLLEFKEKIPLMVLMFQREVAERITAKPGGKDYSPLSIFVQYHTEATLEFTLPKEVFSPQPKVESAVVRFTPRPTPLFALENEPFFFQLVKKSFGQRRKKLLNNLKDLPLPIRRIEEACEACGIESAQRAETIPMEGFARLSNILSSEIIIAEKG